MPHTSTQQVTPEEMLTLSDDHLYELVDGELQEKQMGARECWTACKLSAALDRYNDVHPVGWVFVELTYQCFPHNPLLVRRPDLSFIRFGRFAGETLPEGHVRIAPDLAIEVVSPNDAANKVDAKLEDYHKAQVPHIWTLHPTTHCVKIHRLDGKITVLREGQNLTDEDLLPGFSCPVACLFPKSADAASKS